MKIDPPLGRSLQDWLAQTPVSKGDVRRSPTGTLVAVKILMAPTMVLSRHSTMKTLPWKESEST
jgi:hypothetical protein